MCDDGQRKRKSGIDGFRQTPAVVTYRVGRLFYSTGEAFSEFGELHTS